MRTRGDQKDGGGGIGSLAGYGLIIAAVLLEAAAQLAFKRGTSGASQAAADAGWGYWRLLATSPWIAMGVVLYMGEIVCWLGALHTLPLAIAFPALSLNYVVVVLGAHWWLGERVDRRSAFAIGLIVAGVALVVTPTLHL